MRNLPQIAINLARSREVQVRICVKALEFLLELHFGASTRPLFEIEVKI